jgi:DNA polymerase (family 10)
VGRLTLGRAWDLFERAQSALGAGDTVYPAGGLRRFEPTVEDVTMLVRSSRPTAGTYTISIDAHEIAVREIEAARFGAALIEATGSRPHVERLEAIAARAGLALRELARETEEEIYSALGLRFIPPELRSGGDEIDAAARGPLPDLVARDDVRGDLHLHSIWSDGRDRIEDMVAAADELGYEYIAITDHSPAAGAARVLSEEALLRQIEEIDRIQENFPRVRILKGIEADILPNARLDVSDSLLERLDVVLASLHDPAGHSPGRLLERYRRAAEHPLVNMLTHPANRMVGRHDGYELDFPALFEIARRTGTLLEIDGAPVHLDMDGSVARQAVAAGVTVAIDSDCHHARMLGRYMQFGVGTARRGWVERAQVLNTRRLEDVMSFLRRKRL